MKKLLTLFVAGMLVSGAAFSVDFTPEKGKKCKKECCSKKKENKDEAAAKTKSCCKKDAKKTA